MAERRVPRIRFKGFEEDWEQRKLGEVVNEITRTDENSDAPVMMITASDGFINQSERYSTDNAGQSLRRYILLERGELAYNHGASKLRPYGSCFALTTEEKARVPFVYHCFSTEREEPELLSLVLNGKSVELQLKKIVSSGARMDGLLNISFEEYSSIPINLPIKLEQTKIVDFFRSLDKVISLHQRKLEKLKILKKAMLEKMFPKNGAKVPEIRFSGFTDDWEQRKLGEIFEESNERSSEMDILSVSVSNGIYPASESDRDVNPGASLENYKIVHKGDIVYNSMRMWQGAVGESVYDGIVSPAYVVVRAKQEVDSRYFGYLLKRPEMLYKYLCYSQGNSKDTQTLRYERFAEIEARISIEVIEQQMISRCIGKIDSLLSLHQRKLEKLRQIKKSMLERMFV